MKDLHQKEPNIDIPKVFDISDRNRKDYALKIHPNIYEKHYERGWNQDLVNKIIIELKFAQSKRNGACSIEERLCIHFIETIQY